jgi:hypothetical protein
LFRVLLKPGLFIVTLKAGIFTLLEMYNALKEKDLCPHTRCLLPLMWSATGCTRRTLLVTFFFFGGTGA